MTDPALLPGPIPDPPADFHTRTLPILTLPAGTPLSRIHLRTRGALYYGPRTDPARRGRWDAPDDSFGVCYLAETAHLAFAETFLRDLALEEIGSATLGERSLALVHPVRDLRLAQMHGAGLHRMQATAAVVQASYDRTWAWAQSIHGHPARVDGVRYRARHDDDSLAVAVFDRAAAAVEVSASTPLLDPSLAQELSRWLDRYSLGLAP